jgi:integrase
MELRSFWQLVENSPEWVTAIAAVLLAIVTSIVIYCQLRVMKGQARAMRFQATVLKWQARQSVRLQRAQNALIRLQHEHEWARLNNQERDQILKSARKLHVAVRCLLIEAPSSAEPRFENCLAEAKIPRFCWHALRHTSASRLRAAGVSVEDIRHLLGHSAKSITERYAHPSMDVLRAAVAKLDQIQTGTRNGTGPVLEFRRAESA